MADPPGPRPTLDTAGLRSGAARVALTDLLGRTVLHGGEPLGELTDLVISDVGDHPLVGALEVDGAARAIGVGPVTMTPDGRLAVSTVEPAGELRHPIRLGRDVLDAQIVDLDGHRLVRVGDVELAWPPDGALAVIGVAVGFDAVLRRFGLRRLSRRCPSRLVPWTALHLTSRHGHAVQVSSRAAHLRQLSSDELAHLISRLSTAHAADVVRTAAPSTAAEALSASHDAVATPVLTTMDDDAERLLGHMTSGRAAHLRRLLRRPWARRRYRRTKGWRRRRPTPPGGTAA
jgi:hypothetical protein